MTRLLLAIYLLEAAVVLIVGPWTSYWDRNYFANLVPGLRDWLGTIGFRAAVTGIGVMTGVAGARELSGAVIERARARVQPPHPPPPGR